MMQGTYFTVTNTGSTKNPCEGGSQSIATFPTQFLTTARREPALKEAEVEPVFI